MTGRPTERIAPSSDLLLHDLGPDLADPVADRDPLPGEWRPAPLRTCAIARRFSTTGAPPAPVRPSCGTTARRRPAARASWRSPRRSNPSS
ncbi:MAG TPA: di-heme oxidoredictase family protein [Geminicoccaceae bacterium]|nr:di-heme oxidoredictase family protein [Geminicoccaceae bacterium]